MSWIGHFFNSISETSWYVLVTFFVLIHEFHKLNKKIDNLQKQLCE